MSADGKHTDVKRSYLQNINLSNLTQWFGMVAVKLGIYFNGNSRYVMTESTFLSRYLIAFSPLCGFVPVYFCLVLVCCCFILTLANRETYVKRDIRVTVGDISPQRWSTDIFLSRAK